MAYKDPSIKSSEITPESVYLNRRSFMQGGAGVVLAASSAFNTSVFAEDLKYTPVNKTDKSGFYTAEKVTPYEDVSQYNNFYEFGTDKSDPAKYASKFKADPWEVEIAGLCAKPGKISLEDILSKQSIEERIYRLRCVETWSMVIPWLGFPLAELIKQAEPTSKAKYVAFETVYRPKEMRGQRFGAGSGIDWPYVEGLRMDEAMHPLSFLAVGMYGKDMPNQNGAPIRLVVPWKYGFKSIKSIVKITFTDKQPPTTWNLLAPREYGFYSNVNPKVDHPRWSQKSERRLPSGLFSPNRIQTQMFNGYGEQVASLYKDCLLYTSDAADD